VIRSFLWTGNGNVRRDLAPDEIRSALEAKKGVLWVDMEDPSPEEAALLGADLFNFHPLAIEDCLHAQSRPKVDDHEDYLFLVFHSWNRDDDGIRLEELDVFLGRNYVVTYHVEPRRSVAAVMEKVEKDPRGTLGAGADMLFHQIVDRMVDRYELVVDDIDGRVDRVEDEILENPTEETLRRILELKKDLQDLFRTIRHQRDVVNSLAREGHPNITKKSRQFFRDIYDHVVRVHDTVEGLRDAIGGARDAYLSMVSNRMNEVMKGLSTVATVILPLTFVTGVYGMNFTYMPLLDHPGGFLITCGLMVGLGVAMFLVFRRKGWI